MTTYTATTPLDARVRFGAGTLEVEVTDKGIATATVEALDPTNRNATILAEHARVDLIGGRLIVDVPGKGFRRTSPSLAVRVRLELPALSTLTAQSGELTLTTTGELGGLVVRTGSGEVRASSVRGAVDIKASSLTCVVGTADSVAVTSGRAHLRAQSVGDVTFKAGHGQLELQSTTGQVVVKGGGIALDLREAATGAVHFEVGSGSAHVGVVEGTTVQLDLTSGMGEVRCDVPLESAAPSGGAALRLRLRTGSGDVIVSRAVVPSQDHDLDLA